AHPAPSRLQLPGALRAVLAACALLSELTERLVAPPFERADPPPGDDQGSAGVRRHSGLMDLAQVYCGYCGLCWIGGGLRTRGRVRNGDVQFIPIPPDQPARAYLFSKI